MSATSSTGALCEPAGQFPSSSLFRFGHESSGAAGEWSVEWKLKRNCSLAPHSGCASASHCAVCRLAWRRSCGGTASLLTPFARAEVLAVSMAVLRMRATWLMASGSPCTVIA